jgi:uncharacterized protein (TIGR03067 family)
MRFPLAIGVLAACGLVLAAPVPKDKDKPTKDEDAIQGVWQLDKFEGMEAPPPEIIGKLHFVFKDGKLDVTMSGMPRDKQGTYKLDPAAKPKTIDLIAGDERPAPGIYELDGDTLKICLAEGPNAARPTEFKPDGKRVAVVTFKRMKEDKKDK